MTGFPKSFVVRLAVAAAALAGALPAAPATITVTGTGDGTAASGPCTLREAILNVNNGNDVWTPCTATGVYGGGGLGDTIVFAIPGGGVKTIVLVSPLPSIGKNVTIDGSTQPGASLGTSLATYPDITPIGHTLMIEVDCSALSSGSTSAITVGTGGQGSLIQGLAMGNLAGSSANAALIELNETAYVFGNYLGLRADGVTTWGSISQIGVKVGRGATYSYIGTLGNTGSSGKTRNVIAACQVGIVGLGVQGLVVYGNIIGPDRTGAAIPAQQGYNGIYLDAVSGIAPYVDDIRYNVVSGHLSHAILMGGAYQPTLTNNLIGIGLGSPQTVIGNGGSGIVIANAAGGLVAQKGSYGSNTIAGSGMDGITVLGNSDGNPVWNGLTGNSIFQSAGLGINLEPSGEPMSTVTPNDLGDPDSGPNDLQNFPVVTSAQVNGSGAVVVQFTLNTLPCNPPAQNFCMFAVSAYASPSCSAKGYGEGRYVGASTTVTTDASGNASGTITVPAGTAGWSAGSVVTLLAHDVSQNNTSEFSQCLAIQGAPATATKLAFVQQPTNAVAGAAISPAVTVQLQDAGSASVAQAGVSIQLAVATGTGVLAGTATQTTNASGLATFSNLSVNLVGAKTLSAASGGVTGATSSPFTISAGAATSLVITGGNNQSAAVGTAFGAPLQVLLTDGQGNPVSGAQVTFTAPGSGASAALVTSPATTDAAGHTQVTATANATTGAYAVTAASGTLPTVGFNLTNLAAPTQVNSVPALGTAGLVLLALALSAAGAWLLGRETA